MEEKQILSININNIKDCIYVIRGQKVMLDFDLARIYGYETKNFNRQVKNNNEKFDNDFMFKLTKDEWTEILRCKNFTANSFSKSRYFPHGLFLGKGIVKTFKDKTEITSIIGGTILILLAVWIVVSHYTGL